MPREYVIKTARVSLQKKNSKFSDLAKTDVEVAISMVHKDLVLADGARWSGIPQRSFAARRTHLLLYLRTSAPLQAIP